MTAAESIRLTVFLREMMAILANRSLGLAEKLEQGNRLIQEKTKSGQASVMLYDEEESMLKVVAATRKEIVGLTQKLSPESVSGYVCTYKQPLLIKDIASDCRFSCRGSKYRTSSLISVPLLSSTDDQVIGVINVSDKEGNEPFVEDDLNLLLEYSGWITPLIDNLCTLDRLEKEKERYQTLAQELELKQQELLIASTERTELVQMVVHDFKSPLSAVISNMDLLSYLGASEQQKPIIETAFKGASKLLEMIDDFLHISRLDQWQESGMEPHPVDLLPIVLTEVNDVISTAQLRGINIENRCWEPVQVLGDETMLKHLVQNLISNAVKYTPDHGHIVIGTDSWKSRRGSDPSQTVLKFYVEDNGEGIDDQDKEAIFDKFVRTAKSRESGIKGTGIGLFICRKIVTMFKGKIWVEDVKPHGSRFCVILFVCEEDGHE